MAECSSLKLIMEKGPREGETLTYSPRSVVKIGRIVKGNTIAIKDAGISSKHITIQFDHQLNRWTLCDLDSSNGTILNDQILKPHTPSCLSDGDSIKIGELTSITVKIVVASPIQLRRNPRRQPKSSAAKVLSDDLELGLRNPRRQPKSSAAKVLSDDLQLGLGVDLGENEPVPKRNLRSRSNRSVLQSKKNDEETIISKTEEVNFIPEPQQLCDNNNDNHNVDPSEPRRTRAGRKRAKGKIPLEGDLEEKSSKEMVKDSVPDNSEVLDLEKMTLGDFFDYLELQLPKEICEKSEKIIQDMEEKARKYHEFTSQMHQNENH